MTSGKGRGFQQEVGCRQLVQITDTSSLNCSSEVAQEIKRLDEQSSREVRDSEIPLGFST